ncbi:MAG: hypothetical protein CFE21_00705 [Bacteroidetes bacterium B1(2017)]|nr:MAG: hypothetical protein CFE21_00705 [Bacteroidetes bacterium B1(2017)]
MKKIFLILPLLLFWLQGFGQDIEKKNCYAGVYVNDISSVDSKDGFAMMNFDMWLKWEGKIEDFPKINIQNIYDETITELETVHDDETNWNLKRFNVKGNITCQWNVQYYPFDHHKLNINIMIDDASYEFWELKPAMSNSGLSNVNTVTDWEVYPTLMVNYDTVRNKHVTLDQSREIPKKEMVVFYVEIKRPLLPQFTKIIGPLILITLIGLLALAIPINELEVRTAFAFTALLSIVAYQFTTSNSTPDVSYLTIMDYVFIFGYLFVGTTLIVVWWCSLVPEEKGTYISALTFKIFIPAYLLLNGLIIATKYAESVTGIEEKQTTFVSSREVKYVDTLHMYNFRKRTLSNLNYFWKPGLQESKGENNINFIVTEFPSFKNNMVHVLSDGKMEVYWNIYNNLQWSDGNKLSTDDIEFGFEIEPDTMVSSITTLRRDLIKITYKERVFQPQQRNLPIYPKHYFRGILKEYGRDSVISFSKNFPSPGYGPYYVVSKTDEQVHFRVNPFCPKNTSEFKHIIIDIVPYDTNLINEGKADLFIKNAILPNYFLSHLNDAKYVYENKISDSKDNIVLVNSFDISNGNQAAISNAISKFFNRKEFVGQFFGSPLLSEPAYWPVAKNTKFYDSTCMHCDEFNKDQILNLLSSNQFTFTNNQLVDKNKKQVEITFFELDKNRIPKNLGRMYTYVEEKLRSLGILVHVKTILFPEARFKAVANEPGISLFLEYAMNEEVLTDWTLHLKYKDKLMNTYFKRFDREVIADLRGLLGRRMINYQTTQTHVFVPICSLKPRDTYRKSIAKKLILPYCTIEDLHKYTNY